MIDKLIEQIHAQNPTHIILNPVSYTKLKVQAEEKSAQGLYHGLNTFLGLPIIICNGLADEFLLGKIK